MKRELLFRGFYECENGTEIAVVNGKEYRGKWEFGYYWTNEAGNYFIKVIRDLDGNFVGNPTTNDYEVIPETVCQYTGLKDRNGNEIYEGDIIQYIDSGAEYEVFYDDELARFRLKNETDIHCFEMDSNYDMKIIKEFSE